MSNSNQGDGRFLNWGHSSINSNLPPKSPSVVPDASPFSSAPSRNGGKSHQRTPSMGIIVPQAPFSWIDDMLDSPEAPARKIHHRRSASDTAAFLEFPVESPSKSACEDFRRDEDFPYRNLSLLPTTAAAAGRTCDFERFDDEQIMSMFGAESEMFQRSTSSRSGILTSFSPTTGAGNHEDLERKAVDPDVPTSPSDSNSGNEMSIEDVKPGGGSLNCPKTEPEEVQSMNTTSNASSTITIKTSTKQPTASSHIDPNMDPKRAKRILANRQSAQRSRVRKLQYIAELERSVTALQTEVSALTPQVAYLDHQRILLNVDNSSIKQRIGTLMQDKRFKDAHNEALTREVHRLRQVLQQQEDLRLQLHHYSSSSMNSPEANEVVSDQPGTNGGLLRESEDDQLSN